MLLYSGRNVVVHPCKRFLTGSAVGCGEVTNVKTRFSNKILMRDLGVFRLVCVNRLTDFNGICQNEGDGGSPNADQIWHRCVNIWGYTAPKICIKQPISSRRATRFTY